MNNIIHGNYSIYKKFICIDCGKKVSNGFTKRCHKCDGLQKRTPLIYCIDCKKQIGKYAKRCRSCNAKLLYINGQSALLIKKGKKLCDICNVQANYNRDYWFAFYTFILENNTNRRKPWIQRI